MQIMNREHAPEVGVSGTAEGLGVLDHGSARRRRIRSMNRSSARAANLVGSVIGSPVGLRPAGDGRDAVRSALKGAWSTWKVYVDEPMWLVPSRA